MRGNRLVVTTLALALALGLVGSAEAGVMFDPDGSGGANAIDLGAFDWNQTSFLAQGANTAINNFVSSGGACPPATPCTFEVMSHARLAATIDQSNQVNTPAGLNTDYEITLAIRFTEQISAVVGTNIVAFTTVPGASTAFLQLYFDDNVNANQLTGGGFNDGTLILSSTAGVQPTSGIFTTTDLTPVPLDQFGANDYPGQDTVTGIGSHENVRIIVDFQNPNFFLTPLAEVGITFANISQGLPFISIDPSGCFTQAVGLGPSCTAAHVNGPMSAQTAQGSPSLSPINVGALNAFNPGPGASPDVIAQTDFNAVVTPAVAPAPAPAALMLLGLGLGIAALARFRLS
jgi:hypothetical protein